MSPEVFASMPVIEVEIDDYKTFAFAGNHTLHFPQHAGRRVRGRVAGIDSVVVEPGQILQGMTLHGVGPTGYNPVTQKMDPEGARYITALCHQASENRSRE